MLYYLETMVGTSNFEKFAKAYVQHFKFKTVTSGAFKDLFLEFCRTPTTLNEEQKKEVAAIDWTTILHAPGMPPYTHDFSNSLSADSHALGKKWISAFNWGNNKLQGSICSGGHGAVVHAAAPAPDLPRCVPLLEHFEKSTLPPSKELLAGLDKACGLTPVKNAEIRFKWGSVCASFAESTR